MNHSVIAVWRRFFALFKARNLEFFRDKSSLSWNIAFPVLILVGFSFVFGEDDKTQFKVGIIVAESVSAANADEAPLSDFLTLRYLETVQYTAQSVALDNVRKHKIDLLVAPTQRRYWVNDTSPTGYTLEQLFLAKTSGFERVAIDGKAIRYLDWVLPGILGMNMMFSCLFGVGYVIVRYRKASVLKRLKATPLNPIEFILAQVMSRLFIVVTLSAGVFLVTDWMFDFYMLGSAIDLLIAAILGAICMISLGLLVASRSRSEELTGGLLNLVTWPMMILSGVWFSLEGAPQWLQSVAQMLPLTHLVDAARSIMTDGASLWDLRVSVLALTAMTLLFLALSALLFRWEGDGR
ncbi:ABC transporter permease [Planctobacterium marinum]|uniref:ABC transporter permease n=1 Tax=Planctobacterium marinum TaxID=1631968 RepID=UPI001E44F050|nr:ABC transporter permease [Planctobacterium marinum]MCC2605781.1 ABC transporter permease [Planctobacterium marinum]